MIFNKSWIIRFLLVSLVPLVNIFFTYLQVHKYTVSKFQYKSFVLHVAPYIKYVYDKLKKSFVYVLQGRIQSLERGVHFAEKLKSKKKVTAIMATLYQLYLLQSV